MFVRSFFQSKPGRSNDIPLAFQTAIPRTENEAPATATSAARDTTTASARWVKKQEPGQEENEEWVPLILRIRLLDLSFTPADGNALACISAEALTTAVRGRRCGPPPSNNPGSSSTALTSIDQKPMGAVGPAPVEMPRVRFEGTPAVFMFARRCVSPPLVPQVVFMYTHANIPKYITYTHIIIHVHDLPSYSNSADLHRLLHNFQVRPPSAARSDLVRWYTSTTTIHRANTTTPQIGRRQP